MQKKREPRRHKKNQIENGKRDSRTLNRDSKDFVINGRPFQKEKRIGVIGGKMNIESIEKTSESLTLKIFKIGSDEINFNIIKKMPSTVEVLMGDFSLTKMPLNRRLNDLEKIGLIRRERGKGKLFSTELSKKFISLIDKINLEILKSIKKSI
ncbi:MAG: hypothetical protein PF542_06680 [Nanoarchaeota archaeon]|jgi:DNA-binding HxlR family transcriptional regulator|nr:hypothetical protein [Nanoarchaeota archaeon]